MQRAVGVGLPPSIWVWYLVSRSLGCSACVWAFGRIGSVSRMRVSRLEVVSRRPFILILHSPALCGAYHEYMTAEAPHVLQPGHVRDASVAARPG